MKLYKLLFEQNETYSKEETIELNKKIIANSLAESFDIPEEIIKVTPERIDTYQVFYSPSFTIGLAYPRTLIEFTGGGYAGIKTLPFIPDPNSPLQPDDQFTEEVEKGSITFEDADYEFWQELTDVITKHSDVPLSLPHSFIDFFVNFINKIQNTTPLSNIENKIIVDNNEINSIQINANGFRYYISSAKKYAILKFKIEDTERIHFLAATLGFFPKGSIENPIVVNIYNEMSAIMAPYILDIINNRLGT